MQRAKHIILFGRIYSDTPCSNVVGSIHIFSGSLEYPLVDEFERINIEVLSENDGLSLTDFKDWFKYYNTENTMAIIHFTSFRYSK